jgi:DNA-binding response OmpR family regulator
MKNDFRLGVLMAAVVVWVGEVKSALYLTVSKKYTTYMARSGKRGLELAQAHGANLVVVDANSLRTSGQRMLNTLCRQLTMTSLLWIGCLPAPHPRVVTVEPEVSPRRFAQQVNRLLAAAPMHLVQFGGACLDVTSGRLLLAGAQVSLNPKQSRLCEILFRHGGEVVPRSLLMKEVWNTEYLGDTRTLDVHIRWLRKKLEEHEAQHRLRLVTVRGLGYRMDECNEE